MAKGNSKGNQTNRIVVMAFVFVCILLIMADLTVNIAAIMNERASLVQSVTSEPQPTVLPTATSPYIRSTHTPGATPTFAPTEDGVWEED